MKETFGSGMQDYVNAERNDLLSVAVVEVEKVVRKARARELLVKWRGEDVKSAAGTKAILTPTCALTLVLLQMRLRRPTLVTELSETYLQLSPTQRKILGMAAHLDTEDLTAYGRVWSALQRLIALIDEFPGRKDKVLTESEFQELIASRDPADCQMRRERMFQLANAMLEGTRQCLPKELRDRSDGSVGLDATFGALWGKAGNRSARNLEGDRRTANPDGGWYRGEGSHEGMTKADAAYFNEQTPGTTHKGSSTKDLKWGVEIEVVRQVANSGQEIPDFPLLSVAWSAHIPGAIRGEALRLANSLRERGHTASYFIVDRAYPNGRAEEYAIPLRKLGFNHVFSYKRNEIGVGAFDKRGFIQISGAWYLDTIPKTLRDADGPIYDARAIWFNTHRSFTKTKNPSPEALLAYETAKQTYRDAEELYARQFQRRNASRLKPKGRMDKDGNRRYLIPIDSPDYAKWRAKEAAHQGVTVEMKYPTAEEWKDNPNAGGLKREQYFPWGGPEWVKANGKRNGVESVNANVKRAQYENLGEASLRAVRGNTFTYLVSALALVSENLRKMIGFYKEHLAMRMKTAKNQKIATIYWQAEYTGDDAAKGIEPPG